MYYRNFTDRTEVKIIVVCFAGPQKCIDCLPSLLVHTGLGLRRRLPPPPPPSPPPPPPPPPTPPYHHPPPPPSHHSPPSSHCFRSKPSILQLRISLPTTNSYRPPRGNLSTTRFALSKHPSPSILQHWIPLSLHCTLAELPLHLIHSLLSLDLNWQQIRFKDRFTDPTLSEKINAMALNCVYGICYYRHELKCGRQG